jgi:hypothetical protein
MVSILSTFLMKDYKERLMDSNSNMDGWMDGWIDGLNEENKMIFSTYFSSFSLLE